MSRQALLATMLPALLLAAAACAPAVTDGPDEAGSDGAVTTSPGTAVSAGSADSPSAGSGAVESPASVDPLGDYCAADPPEVVEQRQLPTGHGGRLNSAWMGDGPTAAVLLHTEDPSGLCGFLFFGDHLAQHGLRVVLIDLCGHGQSACAGDPIAADLPAQVEVATDAVRAEGARRVTLVGASLGGTLAVAAARSVGADAVVDLSGPARTGRLSISDHARQITMPALFAYSATDPDRAAVLGQRSRMPSRQTTFVSPRTGRGYQLLYDRRGAFTPLAARIVSLAERGP